MKEKLQSIKEEAIRQIEASDVPEKLNEVRVKFLGKKGELTAVLKAMKDVAPEERPKVGQMVNETRAAIEELLEETKKNMKAVLTDIQDGVFAGKWIAENKNGRTFFNAKRAQLAKHQMETVGAELRKNMLWGDDTDLDTASN